VFCVVHTLYVVLFWGVKRNLTVQLDAETIRKAKVLAAERSTSVTRLVAQEIERLVDEDSAYRQALATVLDQLERGFHMGGGLFPKRESVHER
jgi:predicted transcriptional regulator